ARLVRPGFLNSLGQLLLKLTAPGVPDIYQGNEVWDFSLVDPDNRRAVDYRRRRALLRELQSWDDLDAERLAPHLASMLENMADGRIKLYVTREVLRLRRQEAALFRRGDYRPVAVVGEGAERVCAFLRTWESRAVLVAVPRWTGRLAGEGVRFELPEGIGGRWRNVFTREAVVGLGRFPVGIWVGEF
ncbi:MAG: hypothetical protein ACXW17_10945, partial [Methylomagnum sp.]